MTLSIIVAMAENRVIGVKNRLPWHLSDDLKRFKRITSGHPVIMGRRTFESIGRPLPNRANIIITRQLNLEVAGAVIACSIEDAVARCRDLPGNEEVFIIGGADIYRQAIALANRLYVTLVHTRIEGDAFFPEIPSNLKVIEREESNEGIPHSFLVFAKS